MLKSLWLFQQISKCLSNILCIFHKGHVKSPLLFYFKIQSPFEKSPLICSAIGVFLLSFLQTLFPANTLLYEMKQCFTRFPTKKNTSRFLYLCYWTSILGLFACFSDVTVSPGELRKKKKNNQIILSHGKMEVSLQKNGAR